MQIENVKLELFQKLEKAKLKIPVILKNRQGYVGDYADLPHILGIVVPILLEENLMIFQRVLIGKLETTLVDLKSGAGVSSEYPLYDQQDPMKFGAAVTYARRYSINTLLGIVPENDTDCQPSQPIKKDSIPNHAPQGSTTTKPGNNVTGSCDFILCTNGKGLGKKFGNVAASTVDPDDLLNYYTGVLAPIESPNKWQKPYIAQFKKYLVSIGRDPEAKQNQTPSFQSKEELPF